MGELGEQLERIIQNYLEKWEQLKLKELFHDGMWKQNEADDDLRGQIECLRGALGERDQQLRDYATDIKDFQCTIEAQRRQLTLCHERETKGAERAQQEVDISREAGEATEAGVWALHQVRVSALAADQEKIEERLKELELSGMAQRQKIEQLGIDHCALRELIAQEVPLKTRVVGLEQLFQRHRDVLKDHHNRIAVMEQQRHAELTWGRPGKV